MLYLVSRLITESGRQEFSILGALPDKKKAAKLAADVYKDYNKNASFQNIEMITEWLETRRSYSFRKDKEHRLQLSITELAGEVQTPGKEIIFSSAQEEDALLRRVSEALIDGKHTARQEMKPFSCPVQE